MSARSISLLLLLAACPVPVSAEMVEQADRNGVIYYSPAQAALEVVMYGDPDCGYCRKARRYFRNNDIDFVEYNIRESSVRMREFRRLGGRGTPLIIIGERRIQGFNRHAIEAALAAR